MKIKYKVKNNIPLTNPYIGQEVIFSVGGMFDDETEEWHKKDGLKLGETYIIHALAKKEGIYQRIILKKLLFHFYIIFSISQLKLKYMQHISGLALQYPRKNWGSFWKKDSKEKLTIKAMKLTLQNKGKPQLLGRSLAALIPTEVVKPNLKPIQRWPERRNT